MEAKQRSRKRKQPPSNPFTGVFTRQKSQIFFHSNRSGISRPDPLRKTTSFPPNHPLCRHSSQMGKYRKSPRNENDDGDESIYHISIKDLRARRIFSKPIVPKEAPPKQLGSRSEAESGKNLNPNLYSELNNGKSEKYECESGGFEKSGEETRSDGGLVAERSDPGTDLRTTGCSDGENPNLSMVGKSDSKDCVDDEALNSPSPTMSMSENCDSGGNPNSSVMERCDVGADYNGDGSNGENPSSFVASTGASVAKGEISGRSGGGETLDGLELDCVGKTPDHLSPNLSNRDSNGINGENFGVFDEENVQTTPPDAIIQIQRSGDEGALQNGNASSKSPPKKNSPSKEKKNSSDSKRNMVLKPCSMMKVFRTPNSFSYRRLLPYLMDIANDASCAPKVKPCPKIEIDAEEKPFIPSSQESITDTPKLDDKPPASLPGLASQEASINRKEEGNVSLEHKASDVKSELAATYTSVNPSQDKSQVNWVSPTSQNENLIKIDYRRGVSPNEQKVFDNTGALQEVSQIVEPDQVGSSLASKGSPEGLEKDVNSETSCQLSLYAGGEGRTAHEALKADESPISVFLSSAKLEAVVSSGGPAASSSKGILKRNPRGCRGICNCLNCASFRLNAGKSFEFSRNQMLDAEELVLNMMKELSNLRIMLEKSANGGNNHSVLPVDQMQEACRRASHMEDLARNRLSQMNEDLYVHCRTKSLQRPKVNFSSCVEKKLIEKSTKQIGQNTASRSLAL